MPALETKDLYQRALVWTFSGNYDRNGQPIINLSTPMEISVRWNWRKARATTPDGNTITLDASVVVGERVNVGSLMWLGTLEDWNGVGSSSSSSAKDNQLCQVKTVNWLKDIKGRNRRHELGLMRFKDTLNAG